MSNQKDRQLSVPCKQTAPGPIVVGVIPDQPAAVVERAAGFAAALNAKLQCVWVDPASYTRRAENGAEQFISVDPDAADTGLQDIAAPITAELADRLAPYDITWSFQSVGGEPARELSRFATLLKASMIVVGTREPGIGARFEELLTGSVAVHLAHHQSCPVMVIPLHPKPFSEARR